MRRQRKHRVMSEINVVPYIDVMLVLLIIFMITAPIVQQGVEIELPQAAARALTPDQKEPLILTVSKTGEYFLNVGEHTEQAIEADVLVHRVAAVIQHQPETPVLVRGDVDAGYGQVTQAMVLLQTAGVEKIGLMTEQPDS